MSAAAWAVPDHVTRGRRHAEPAAEAAPFELDRQRVLHCAAFRRLVGKTQVFVTHEGDHFRTRLTHTLEVAQVARRIARRLGLNEALADAVALAHDLGHPPFGHAGEKALAELMADQGGFEHNVQSLRVVDYLEHPYPTFRGLNLTFELREGLIKHCTPYDKPTAPPRDAEELFAAGPLPPLEGQVANLADQIAYTVHDVEDGLMQGLLDEEALAAAALWRESAEPVRREWPRLATPAVRRPILDALAERLVGDAVLETSARLAQAGADVDVRRGPGPLAAFSAEMSARLRELQSLLLRRVYRHHHVVRMDAKARRLIRELFAAYVAEPALLPPRYGERIAEQGAARVACDYIAGMTDRYCRAECARLFDPERFD
ncbi:MAG: deoxyguanosinetriphosphate triphosphohydrolase [Phycisphaerae bacterium]